MTRPTYTDAELLRFAGDILTHGINVTDWERGYVSAIGGILREGGELNECERQNVAIIHSKCVADEMLKARGQ